MEEYMRLALKESLKAYRFGDVPIGCIIVKNGKVISKAYNKKEKHNIVTEHAEILAINKACRKLKNWRLIDCEIYCTMEPCHMCYSAIKQARIKKIFYGVSNNQFGGVSTEICIQKNTDVISGVLEAECKKIVQEFFKEKRE